MKKKYKNIVVGAGFSGAVIAERLASILGEKVLIVDKKEHLAGNCYDYYDKNGICIHKYGSHIFHTQSEEVWTYLKKFTTFNTYMHRVLALIDGIEAYIPFNLDTLHKLFPSSLANRLEEKLINTYEYGTKIPIMEFKKQDDKDLNFLANYIYEKVFLHYTVKQWGQKPEDIDFSVSGRVPVVNSRDNRYFQDKYQGIPTEGYSKVVEKILNHPNIEIKLNTDFSKIKDEIEYERLFYTGSIDEFFEYEYGILPYRSVNFDVSQINQEFYQSNAVVNYPNNYDFTRIHEYKYYLNDKSAQTIIAKEYSEEFELGKNERYYPISNDENNSLYADYIQKAKGTKNVYFMGRLGDYKYYNMDETIQRSLNLFNEINT